MKTVIPLGWASVAALSLAGCATQNLPSDIEPGSFEAGAAFVSQAPAMVGPNANINRIVDQYDGESDERRYSVYRRSDSTSLSVSGDWEQYTAMTGAVDMHSLGVSSCDEHTTIESVATRFSFKTEADARRFMARAREWGVFVEAVPFGNTHSYRYWNRATDAFDADPGQVIETSGSAQWSEFPDGTYRDLSVSLSMRYSCPSLD